jgi:hypothetical protein
VRTAPPQDEANFPAGRYVITYTDDVPQGFVVLLERWENGRPVVSGPTRTFPLDLAAVRMASSHGTYRTAQKARLAACREEHMTDGELIVRVTAWERELPWAPPADDAQAYGAWFARTADKRAAAQRADVELKARGRDLANEPKVTTAEWLQQQRKEEQQRRAADGE